MLRAKFWAMVRSCRRLVISNAGSTSAFFWPVSSTIWLYTVGSRYPGSGRPRFALATKSTSSMKISSVAASARARFRRELMGYSSGARGSRNWPTSSMCSAHCAVPSINWWKASSPRMTSSRVVLR